MNFKIIECPQRSPEWYAARLGRLTGSCANDMLKTVKSGEAAGRRDLRTRLVLERLTCKPHDSSVLTPDMQHGIETEATAITAYEALTDATVERVGFCQHRSLMAGCSPDGHVDDFDWLISVKCPKSATHLETVKSRVIPTEYLRQIWHELWITGARGCDFFSFDPRFPYSLRACLIPVKRNEEEIAAYEQTALAFLAEVDRDYEALLTVTNLEGQLRAAARAV